MKHIITANPSHRFSDLWTYRELFILLVARDIKSRYKQTVVGVFWTVLQPIISMLVFTFVFGSATHRVLDTIPYPIFLYSGLLIWNLFSHATNASTESIIANQNIVKKTYIPRLILPLSAVMVHFVDFCISFLVFFALCLIFSFTPNIVGILMFLLVIPITLLLAASIGMLLAPLNTLYRDIRFLVSYGMQILMFLTPIMYPASFIDHRFQLIFQINPLTALIDAVRINLFYPGTPFVTDLVRVLIITVTLFILGIVWFTYTEKRFVDVL